MNGSDPPGSSSGQYQPYLQHNARSDSPHQSGLRSEQPPGENLKPPGYSGQRNAPMTNHAGASSSSDLPPAYDGSDPAAAAYTHLGKTSSNAPAYIPTQRTASGRSLPVPPGQGNSLNGAGMSGSRQTSGPRPLPARPPLPAPPNSSQSTERGRNHAPDGAYTSEPKPRKPLPTTPNLATQPHSAENGYSQQQQGSYDHPQTAVPNNGYANVPFPNTPFAPNNANGAPIPPSTSPIPHMTMFPPSYLYDLYGTGQYQGPSGLDPAIYQNMPSPLGMNLGMGMMAYPPYFPPGYMPPGWSANISASAVPSPVQNQGLASVPPQQTPEAVSHLTQTTSPRPAPIAVPIWPVTQADGNNKETVDLREPDNLTPRPFGQDSSGLLQQPQGYFQHYQAQAPAVENGGEAINNSLPPTDVRSHPTPPPLHIKARTQTTRQGRGMEYLESLGVSKEASIPSRTPEIPQGQSWTANEQDPRQELAQHYSRLSSDVSLPSQTETLMHMTPYSNYNQSHRESTVSIPHTIQSVGEGPSHAHERLARVPSLAPSWISHAREGGRPPARWVQNKLFLHQSHAEGREGEFNPDFAGDSYWDGDPDGDGMYRDDDEDSVEEENEMNFFMPSLESHVAVQLRDRVERNTHIKGGISWPASFTGRDVVVSH